MSLLCFKVCNVSFFDQQILVGWDDVATSWFACLQTRPPLQTPNLRRTTGGGVARSVSMSAEQLRFPSIISYSSWSYVRIPLVSKMILQDLRSPKIPHSTKIHERIHSKRLGFLSWLSGELSQSTATPQSQDQGWVDMFSSPELVEALRVEDGESMGFWIHLGKKPSQRSPCGSLICFQKCPEMKPHTSPKNLERSSKSHKIS